MANNLLCSWLFIKEMLLFNALNLRPKRVAHDYKGRETEESGHRNASPGVVERDCCEVPLQHTRSGVQDRSSDERNARAGDRGDTGVEYL